jgi:hypothetical protein
LVAANNLVTCLRGTGAVEQAMAQAERVLATLRERLGGDHPFTLSCAVNLANCLADANRLAEAEQLDRATYRRMCDKLGPLHPDTLVCAANLAVTLRKAGRGKEADELREQSVLALQAVGPETTSAGATTTKRPGRNTWAVLDLNQ